MTRPTDWDFSKVSGKGDAPAAPEPACGEMPAFAIHIEKRMLHPEEALPWADVEFERISKSPRRAAEPARPVAVKRRFPRFRLRRIRRNPSFSPVRPKLPVFRLPRFKIPRPSMPQVSLPRVSLPRISLPQIAVPRVALPAMPAIAMPKMKMTMTMPRIALPRLPTPRLPGLKLWRQVARRPVMHRAPRIPVDWRGPVRRVAELRAPVMRGLHAAAFGLRVAAVAVTWLSAELVYFVRLGYAHARLAMPRFAQEIGNWSADRFSGVDLRPLARQAAIVGLFVAVGCGAAAIVGPVLKNSATRLAALPTQPPAVALSDQAEPIAAETRAVVASLDTAAPLPMPRIAHLPAQVRKRAAALRTVAFTGARVRAQNEQPWIARRLMPASQSNGHSLYGSDLVSEIQIRLLRLGYPAGPPTGALNARTRRAIFLFQRDAAIPVTGDADMRLVRRLRDSEGGNLRFAGR
ncbi:MAG TPA: peptidoglycan-binding domain-containing protein [Parvibaculum sp.]|jgi:hypothetical protein